MIALAVIAALVGQNADADHRLGAISVAVQRHDECIEASARKFIPSSEPADVVASAAMWECSGRFMDVFEAGVAYKIAASPTSDPQTIRFREAAELPQRKVQRREQAIYFVVTTRMGLSWHMPREPYNSRQ